MKELLQRVKKARKEALYTFLKERTTHDLAAFIRDASIEIRESLAETIGESSQYFWYEATTEETTEAIAKALEVSFSAVQLDDEGEMVMDSFLNILKERLDASDRSLAAKLDTLIEHFSKAHRAAGDMRFQASFKSDRQKRILVQLKDMYKDATERGIRMEGQRIKEHLEGSVTPESLIFQGGGAKGFAYSGVIQHLEDSGVLAGIKRVGGTSAGALMALPVAMGYSADEVYNIVQNGRFAQFYSESTTVFNFLTKAEKLLTNKSVANRPYQEAHLLTEFSSDFLMPKLERVTKTPKEILIKEHESVTQLRLKELENKGDLNRIYLAAMREFKFHLEREGRADELDVLDFSPMLGRSDGYQAALNTVRLLRDDKHPDSEIIESFIADVIQHKLEQVPRSVLHRLDPSVTTINCMRNINFSQLRQLAQIYPEGGFKEFGVAVTDSHLPMTLSNLFRSTGRLASTVLKRISGKGIQDIGMGVVDRNWLMKPVFVRAPSENSDKNTHVDMPIKKAVRASMNLPLVFGTIRHDKMRMVDGGLTNNFPHRLFSDYYATKEEAKEKTLGFMLSGIETDIEVRQMQDLLKNKSHKLHISFDEDRLSTKDKLRALAVKMKTPVKSLVDGVKSQVADFVSKKVNAAMGLYNTTMPSLEEMDNVGIINTGIVGTADFHLSKKGRQKLHQSGVYSSISLMKMDEDRDLRFALGRLVSLIHIEKELDAENISNNSSIDDILSRLHDSGTLASELGSERYAEWELSDLLLGEPLAKGRRDAICMDDICYTNTV